MAKKIKNPERYIGRLKSRIKQLEEWLDDSEAEVSKYGGTTEVVWAKGIIDKNSVSESINLGNFKLNDYVVVVGKVTKVKQWYNDNDIPCSYIKFKRLRTKKVETY